MSRRRSIRVQFSNQNVSNVTATSVCCFIHGESHGMISNILSNFLNYLQTWKFENYSGTHLWYSGINSTYLSVYFWDVVLPQRRNARHITLRIHFQKIMEFWIFEFIERYVAREQCLAEVRVKWIWPINRIFQQELDFRCPSVLDQCLLVCRRFDMLLQFGPLRERVRLHTWL